MALIVWNNAYAVGHIMIDAQHQKLVALINDLHDRMAKGDGNAVLGATMDEVVRYTRMHFSEEEKLLEKAGYRQLAEHRVQHQRFVAKLETFQSDFRAGKLGITVRFLVFLKEWLVQHIMQSDQAYVPALTPASASARR